MPIPRRRASAGPDRDAGLSPMTRVPASGAYSPAATFIRDDLPAPFSPSRAWTSPDRTEKTAPSSAMAPSNDFRNPVSSRTTLMSGVGLRSFLRNHARDIPVHFPKRGIIGGFTGGDPLGAGGVLERPGIDMLAGDDRITFGHHFGDGLFGDDGIAAGDVGAAILDAGEGAERGGFPVSGGDLLERRNQVFLPGPGRRAQRRLGGEFAEVAVMSGAGDAALLSGDLRRRRIDVLADDVAPLIPHPLGGAPSLHAT